MTESCHQCGAPLRFICTRVAEHGAADCYRCTQCDAGGHRTQAGEFGPAFETQYSHQPGRIHPPGQEVTGGD